MEPIKFFLPAKFLDKYVMRLPPVDSAVEFFTARDLIMGTRGGLSGKIYPVYYAQERGLKDFEVGAMIEALCLQGVLAIANEGISPKGASWVVIKLTEAALKDLELAKAENKSKFANQRWS